MNVVSIDQLPFIGPAALTLGVFDGVHRGHQLLLAATRQAARATELTSVALVFDPPPAEVLDPDVRVQRLGPLEENLERIGQLEVHALAIRFDDRLRSLAPDEFIDALAPSLALRALVMTPESAFGRGRTGTAARMRELGQQRGFELITVEPLLIDDQPVSSSRIRAAIGRGELELATELLGRPPTLIGTVVRGDGRGRELGFPTANLAFDYHPSLPPLGIYLGRVSVPERGVTLDHPALVSIGVRPTFHAHGEVLVEVFLLDWSGDLYGARLRVDLVARLREERRFASVEALIGQMQADEAQARVQLVERPSVANLHVAPERPF